MLYNVAVAQEQYWKKDYLAWKTLQKSLKWNRIDRNLQKMIQCEIQKWKAILQQILVPKLFLASRSLDFYGENILISYVHKRYFFGTTRTEKYIADTQNISLKW